MKRAFVIAFLFLTTDIYACLNIFSIDSSGRVHYLEHHFFFSIEFKQNAIEKKLKELKRKFDHNEYSFQNISDFGSYLLMTGRFADGLNIFRALSKKYPDVYEICANTAVAYELNGNIDSAYLWQVAAIKKNPKAHNNSEWIHLKILEAKKNILTDPDWCLNNNVTGITDTINTLKVSYEASTHESEKGMWVFKQFIDQLEDRFPFTYSEDKAMGKLMYELGDAYQVASVYRSYYCYAIAKYLYPALSTIADKKMNEIKMKYPKNSVKAEGRTIALTPRSPGDNEMIPPTEIEVNKFINKLINRPALKVHKISVIIEQLISKI